MIREMTVNERINFFISISFYTYTQYYARFQCCNYIPHGQEFLMSLNEELLG